MIKFSNRAKPATENYWSYCGQHQIPYIEIIPVSRDYVNISYDLLSCLPFHKLKGEVLDRVMKIYEGYCDFFKLPKNRISLAGGDIAFGFVVKKEHSEFIANQLFDFLSDFVSKNKILVTEDD